MLSMLVVVLGIGVLLVIGTVTGIIEGRDRRGPRIAAQRRELWEVKQELLAREAGLVDAVETGACPRCRSRFPDGWGPRSA